MKSIPTVPDNSSGLPETVWLDSSGSLCLLDQTQLPHRVVGVQLETVDDVYQAIRDMVVRGAPAIGVAAAHGMLVDPTTLRIENDPAGCHTNLVRRAEHLNTARPTAVNLSWATDRMVKASAGFCDAWQRGNPCTESTSSVTDRWWTALQSEAAAIHQTDRQMCRQIGLHGADLIPHGGGVLTHCNAGSLATSQYGTATAPLYISHEAGKSFRAYADETRPRWQGSRLTAWELSKSGIDTTILCDNMAASLMAAGRVDVVLVGADRVVRSGDAANKIGTLPLAIVAAHFGVDFYVAFPSSTYDPALPDGTAIEIEQRDASEVTHVDGRPVAAEGVRAWNPAFDVTPADLITGYITEHGRFRSIAEVAGAISRQSHVL